MPPSAPVHGPSRARRGAWFCACLSTLLVATSGSAKGLWSQLSDDDRAAVLAEVQAELAVSLRSQDRSLLPRRSDGSIDPGFESLVENLAEPGSASLSQYAGEIAAGEYDRAVHSAISSGLSALAGSLRDGVIERLPEGSALRVYSEYLSDKGDVWTEVARMALDDRFGWGEVAETAWTKLNAAAADDVADMTESALTSLLTEAVGSWASMGYVAFLKAQVAYIGEVEKLAVALSADSYYRQYRALRDGGKSPGVAWEELEPYLLGEGGLPSAIDGLRRGSGRDLRAAGFLERHVSLDRLRDAYEACYPSVDRCVVRAEDLYSVDKQARMDALEARRAKTRAEVRAELEASGGVTRAELRSVYAHVGDLLRRKLTERMNLSDGRQQALAVARNDVETLLARLRQVRDAMRAAAGEAPRLAADLDGWRGEADALFARAEEIGRLGFECRQATATPTDLRTTAAADLTAAIEAADRASSRACDYDEPTSRVGALQLRDRVLAEWNRTKTAAAEGKAALGRLAEGVASDAGSAAGDAAASTGGGDGPRQRLAAIVDALESDRTFDEARVASAHLAALGHRTAGQAEVARGWLADIEGFAAPWRGVADIDASLAEARALLGEGAGTQTGNEASGVADADSIGTMVARVAVAAHRGQSQGKWFSLSLPSLEDATRRGREALAGCGTPTAPGDLGQLVATADSRLDASTSAADLCLARAQLLLEEFDAPADSGWGGGTFENTSAPPADDGWQAGELVRGCETPAAARGAIDGALGRLQAAVMQPDQYAEVLAAVDAMVTAASDPNVCAADRDRVRGALQLVQNAQSLQLAQARDATAVSLAEGRARQARRAAAWGSAAAALTGLLDASRARPNGNSGPPPSRLPEALGSSGPAAGAGSGGPGASGSSGGACDGIRASLQRRIGEWQSLLSRRGSIDDASWCRQAVAWQRGFTTELQSAERSGCVEVQGNNSRALLESSRSSLNAFSCDTNN